MQRFSKRQRLLNACDYQWVFDNPSLRASHPNILLLAKHNRFEHPRLGLVISKKNIKLACQRNRVKRLVRESFRTQQDILGNIDVIVLARRNLDQLSNPELHKLLNKQWQRLVKSAAKHKQTS